MTETNDLASLTLKDLRQLAGEHQIRNRSRLAKQQLIDALQRLSQSRASEGAAPTPAKADGGDKRSATGRPGRQKASAGKKAKKPAEVKKPAAPAEAEPEVLGPEQILGQLPEKPAAKHEQPARKGQSAEAQAAAAAKPEASDSQPTDAAMEDGGEAEGGGRKRRRKRRRRGKRREGDADEQSTDDSKDAAKESPAEQVQQAPSSTEAAPDQDGRNAQVAISSKDAAENAAPGGKADRPTAKKPAQESTKKEGAPATRPDKPRNGDRKDALPPKPKLDSKQESLASVLDRLKEFTAGVLELCDPDTPSWAQARLSELLAAAGVVPTPCSGKPHPKFHQVVGTIRSERVAHGEIALIEAPGFSLRGDRGDLFPLRQARVRIAGDRSSDAVSADRTDEPRTEPAKDPSPSDQPTQEAEASASKDQVEATTAPAPDSDAPTPDSDAPAPPSEHPAEQATPQEDDAAKAPSRRGRERRSRSRTPQALGPVEDEPEPRATDRHIRVVEADEAPAMPLPPVDADELASRAKAEDFRPLGLNEQVLADLADVGWQDPSPIQAAAIPVVLGGADMIGQAQTGTGKTGAFALPILHRLYEWEGPTPAALILCPTRELARQVDAEFNRMAGTSGARSALIYGGVSMDGQLRALARHPHVIIGTPGRIIDHMKRRTLDLSHLRLAVLDEADQMLDIGFLPDIEYILAHTPPTRQTMLFSATMPEEIKKLAKRYMREPEHIHVLPERVTADQVDQKYIAVDRDKKNKLLAHFIETYQPEQLVVFCKTKSQTDRVAQVLKRKRLAAQAIHGDLPQSKRERTLSDFREGKLQCLIATNVAARGLDIPTVSHVVNYDIPENPEEYVHRIGRTGRMGNPGVARTFVTPEDGQFVVEIEKHIGLLLEEEVVEGITASTAQEVQRTIASIDVKGPRLLKPIAGGIRLGRRRR